MRVWTVRCVLAGALALALGAVWVAGGEPFRAAAPPGGDAQIGDPPRWTQALGQVIGLRLTARPAPDGSDEATP